MVRVRHPAHYTRKEVTLSVVLAVEPGNPNLDPGLVGSMMLAINRCGTHIPFRHLYFKKPISWGE